MIQSLIQSDHRTHFTVKICAHVTQPRYKRDIVLVLKKIQNAKLQEKFATAADIKQVAGSLLEKSR